MFSKYWLVIKDDAKHTYEVVSQATSENGFVNKVIAMQRDGMSVTSVILPVTNRTASKENITFIGYTREAGLHERLLKQHQEIILRNTEEEWE